MPTLILRMLDLQNVRIGSLGTWRVTAKGLWEDSGDGVGADVGYQTVSVVPVFPTLSHPLVPYLE